MMLKPRMLPKTAVKQLLDYCVKKEEETGASAAKLMREYLLVMRRHADYFFCGRWPEKIGKRGLWLSEEEWKYVFSSKKYLEMKERLLVACLRRNITLDGFYCEGFDYDFQGNSAAFCLDCVVEKATGLRKHILLVDLFQRENDAKMESGEASEYNKDTWFYNRKPQKVKENKMHDVELKLYEEIGRAEGKACIEGNRYNCPYKAKSTKLADCGSTAKFIWKLVKYYDDYWNGSPDITPCAGVRRFCHFGEPSIIDVTDYEDIIRACSDGRMMKIKKEHDEFQKGIPY
jgi:hypothetical protein